MLLHIGKLVMWSVYDICKKRWQHLIYTALILAVGVGLRC